ncbi:MAG: SDR family oxidoreductase [Planifilum sp.]|mgnify:CR=1 FL=1|jgi:short-subunit dehydrogenase
MKRVLVAGATGYLGRYLVKELKRQGYFVKVLVRNPDRLSRPGDFLAPAVGEDVDEIAIGDLTQPNTLKRVCPLMSGAQKSIPTKKSLIWLLRSWVSQNRSLTFQSVYSLPFLWG